MINKIVCASYGDKNSGDIINSIISFAKQFKSELVLLYIKPESNFEVLKNISGDDNKLFSGWIEDVSAKEINRINEIAEQAAGKGINCKVEVRTGALYNEILDYSKKEKADLIAVTKKRCPGENSQINRTVLKLIRQSEIPVFTINDVYESLSLNNILVPTGLSDSNSDDLKYALDISRFFNSKVHQLNVLETEEYNFPADLVFKYMDYAQKKLSETFPDDENVEQHVIESKNAYSGIFKYIKDKKIDLIVMNTYRGEQGEKKDFIGSIAERILQTAGCPVITIRPK